MPSAMTMAMAPCKILTMRLRLPAFVILLLPLFELFTFYYPLAAVKSLAGLWAAVLFYYFHVVRGYRRVYHTVCIERFFRILHIT